MFTYQYNKDDIKKNLTIEQIHSLVAELGGNPQPIKNNYFISQTISHNDRGVGHYKLYYYDNGEMGIFKDYTGGGDDSFDVFELVRRVKSREEPLANGKDWELPQAVSFVAQYFGFSPEEQNFDTAELDRESYKLFENYDRINNLTFEIKTAELKEYEDKILKNLPKVNIPSWEAEGITKEAMDAMEICYDPKACGIVIPHRDKDSRLVGIRERTLGKEEAELYGKYRPAYIAGQLWNHPLSFNLYGLHLSKENISKLKTAIVFESEKSVLQYISFFGLENNIAVASCGSSLSVYQIQLLKDAGAEEIIIAYDKAGKDDDKTKYVKKFYDFRSKHGNMTKLSFIYDKNDKYLDWKMSPTDKGKDIFIELFKKRIIIK